MTHGRLERRGVDPAAMPSGEGEAPGGLEELLRATSRSTDSRIVPPAREETPPSDEEMQRTLVAIEAYGRGLLD